MNYAWLRPCLFILPPELAHAVVLKSLRFVPSTSFQKPNPDPVQAMGLTFSHRVGLAAGLDKSGQYVDALQKLQFSFIEVGTVTPLPQTGNPKPRLFRLKQHGALINRMGFNNLGMAACVQALSKRTYTGVLGVNIGKNKATALNQAAEDYLLCYEKIYPIADYVTINISSPNTPELRTLQSGSYLTHLLEKLLNAQKRMADQHQRSVPLVIKCSPDETVESIKHLAQSALSYGIAGIIATNTTIARPGLEGVRHATEVGGLSGVPLRQASTAVLKLLKREVGDAITLIASGGIDGEAVAREKLAAGATLLQVYTGLIYQGPGLVQKCGVGKA